MKKLLIFILVAMLLFTDCSSNNENISSSKEKSSVTENTVSSTDKQISNPSSAVGEEEIPDREGIDWPEAQESDMYKVEVVAENLEIDDVSNICFKNGYAEVALLGEDEAYSGIINTKGKLIYGF